MGVRIKICGMTRLEDAKTAANLGVDALGFIFTKKSQRYIAPADAREIIMQLPPFISRVGVFVDESIQNIIDIVRETGVDTVQLHGSESPDFCKALPIPVIKSVAVKPGADLSLLDAYKVSGFLLDTWSEGNSGGTGKTFDWTIAKKAVIKYDSIILAGGLGPSNVEEALRVVHPYGVDINSGVEIMPGVKNPHKMRDIVRIVRNWKSI
jgi:phosphoribosylanthranilate isomerase